MQAALSDACTASLDTLFPPQFNLSDIKRVLDTAQPDVQSVVPSPLVGFTLFVASNAALDSTNGGSSAPSFPVNTSPFADLSALRIKDPLQSCCTTMYEPRNINNESAFRIIHLAGASTKESSSCPEARM